MAITNFFFPRGIPFRSPSYPSTRRFTLSDTDLARTAQHASQSRSTVFASPRRRSRCPVSRFISISFDPPSLRPLTDVDAMACLATVKERSKDGPQCLLGRRESVHLTFLRSSRRVLKSFLISHTDTGGSWADEMDTLPTGRESLSASRRLLYFYPVDLVPGFPGFATVPISFSRRFR